MWTKKLNQNQLKRSPKRTSTNYQLTSLTRSNASTRSVLLCRGPWTLWIWSVRFWFRQTSDSDCWVHCWLNCWLPCFAQTIEPGPVSHAQWQLGKLKGFWLWAGLTVHIVHMLSVHSISIGSWNSEHCCMFIVHVTVMCCVFLIPGFTGFLDHNYNHCIHFLICWSDSSTNDMSVAVNIQNHTQLCLSITAHHISKCHGPIWVTSNSRVSRAVAIP